MMRTVLTVVGIAALSVAALAQHPATKPLASAPVAPKTQAPVTQTPVTQTKPAQSSGPKAAESKATEPKAVTPKATAAWPNYCSADAGFCVKYPPDWKKQTDVLQGAGVVVAKTQAGQLEDLWPQITAAATLMPEEPEGKEAPNFDDVLNVVLESIEPGAEKQTLQRTQTTADGLPAQLVKIKYIDTASTPWIEEGLFIDGEDAIYSVVLRTSPEQLAAAEPVFLQMTQTWRQYAAPAKAAPAAPTTAPTTPTAAPATPGPAPVTPGTAPTTPK